MALGQNISFMKGFSIFPRTSKLILKTGNEIIQKENWNLSPNSSSLIQMTFKKCFSFSLGVQNWFSKQEMEIFKQEINFFCTLSCLWSKKFFCKILLIFAKELQNREWNHPNRKGNQISNFQPPDQKCFFYKMFYHHWLQNWFLKQEMELSKQEIKTILSFPGLWSKISFY